ncbi:MAG TPA: TetR/AcrR family transcriptional regulator [Spirochaetota bacterium]|nr:TetR/AcrR family transcriptional regulator [Spirochaetota bacterium]HNT10239.1 TetR/AcrR family transcriptional regulator [Spirochaetota bacterium]HNV48085.1 TetR/AcrR family transcriptional regulator [Spirochaetota bacterium]HPU88343.1 TetR/AcrR family transcriptional regulator [Spirochaetota bacterium]
MRKKVVPTQVKNPELVNKRRQQIIDASVRLFIKQGFHKSTTRQIARKAGFSIGKLYEYITTKEDVLYLVCDYIHRGVEEAVKQAITDSGTGRESLESAIREYFRICDSMSDDILLIYQEIKSLARDAMHTVLARDVQITELFEQIIDRGIRDRSIKLNVPSARLLAHNIMVLGHMWTFRRWYLSRTITIDQYIEEQLQFILNSIGRKP